MKLDTFNCEEFDRRLEQSTARMRQQCLTLEARAAELEDLISLYTSVLERMEAKSEQDSDPALNQRDELRDLLTELAERTSAVAGGGAFAWLADESDDYDDTCGEPVGADWKSQSEGVMQ